MGKTVAEIGEMGNDEWVRWQVHLGRRAQREELAANAKRVKR